MKAQLRMEPTKFMSRINPIIHGMKFKIFTLRKSSHSESVSLKHIFKSMKGLVIENAYKATAINAIFYIL